MSFVRFSISMIVFLLSSFCIYSFYVPDVVTAGDQYTIAIKSGGSLYAWGDNNQCQPGNETTAARLTRVKIIALDYSSYEIAASDAFPWEIFYPAFMKKKKNGPPEVELIPSNQFNIGDSIGEGEAADNVIGSIHHDVVWSTGYNPNDIVYSLNERFEDAAPDSYTENNATRDSIFNKAKSGAVMADFVSQANQVVAEADSMGGAGMVTILLGDNDVCASSLDNMTDPNLFETQFRAGLDVLASSSATKNAVIHVSGVPAIYWLWVAKKDSTTCQLVWYLGGVCQALLKNPHDDCASIASRDDPDNDYPGDGANCIRRKKFYRKIRDVYNQILRDVTEEYRTANKLPNAYYVDIYDIAFDSSYINDGDCFHPNTAGHGELSGVEWDRSKWGTNDK